MDLDKETQMQIQELQILEQNLQGFLVQKQTIQMELNESDNALGELKNSGEEVYRVLGQIMVKSDKEKVSKEIEEKKKLLEAKIGSIEKQEKLLGDKAVEMREVIEKIISKNAPAN